MEHSIVGSNITWTSRALCAALVLLPLWLSGCADDKKTDPPPTNTFDLTVSLTGSGQVTSSPAGIACGSDCAETLAVGSSITLNATPASSFTFSGWSGDCSGTASCAPVLNANRTVTATFTATLPPAAQYTLSVNVAGTGSVSSSPAGISCGADCTESYTDGTSVTLTATPGTGFQFSSWSGACSGTGSCVVAMTEARSVTATFSANPPPAAQYPLTVSVTGTGSVSSNPAGISCGTDCTENYTDGTSVTLTATPGANQQFYGWTNACTGTQLTCTVSMTEARSVSASFTPVLRALSITVNGTGSVTSAPAGINCGTDCSENYAHGSNLTLTATPGANQQFSGWLGTCSGTTTTCMVAMTEARSVTATFAPILTAQFTLTVSVTGSGSVSSSPAGISCGSDCTESYASGQSVTLTATAGTGFQFSSWSGACSGSDPCVVAMNMNRAVTAIFTQTPPVPGNISISGTFTHGMQVTLTGSGFGSKSPAAPLVWATFEPGQGANSDDRNPTTKGRRASWDVFQSASMLSTALAPANSTQALRMDMARDTGWPPAAPADFADSFGAQISLAPADAGVIYMRGKIYKDWHITEICQLYNICSINDKMWRTWRSDGSSSNQVITNMYSNWHHNPLDDGRVTTENAGNVAPCAQWTDRPYPFRQWNTDEWWYRRSSGANASDGALRFMMNNVIHAEMLACVNLTSADPIGSTDFGIYEDFANVPNINPRPVGWWTYFKDVYIDNTWARVVVADNATYASATSTEIQIPVAWSDTGITIEVNQGAFASFTGKYVFVFNSQNQVVGFTQIP